MAEDRAMLVVDDEDVVCQACRRIFSRQGFQVESNTMRGRASHWPRKGLHDHPVGHQDAQHQRIEFLERLRAKKPDVPVLIITGFPVSQTRRQPCVWVPATTCPNPSRPKRSRGRSSGAQYEGNSRNQRQGSCFGGRWIGRSGGRAGDAFLGRILGAACGG